MNCTICCDQLKKNQVKLACGHEFHNKCLMHWLIGHDTCPICRYQINPKNKLNTILNEEDDDEIKIYINPKYPNEIQNYMINVVIDSLTLGDESWTDDYLTNYLHFRYITKIFQKKMKGYLIRMHLYVRNWNTNSYEVYCALIETLVSKSCYFKQSKSMYISKHKSNRKCNKQRNQNYFRKRPKVY